MAKWDDENLFNQAFNSVKDAIKKAAEAEEAATTTETAEAATTTTAAETALTEFFTSFEETMEVLLKDKDTKILSKEEEEKLKNLRNSYKERIDRLSKLTTNTTLKDKVKQQQQKLGESPYKDEEIKQEYQKKLNIAKNSEDKDAVIENFAKLYHYAEDEKKKQDLLKKI